MWEVGLLFTIEPDTIELASKRSAHIYQQAMSADHGAKRRSPAADFVGEFPERSVE